MNDAERIVERLNYDLEELGLSKSEYLMALISLGKEVDDLHKLMAKESKKKIRNMKIITATLVKLTELQEIFDEAKIVYNDLVSDMKAIVSYKGALKLQCVA